jgi:hypothetical protein
VIRSEDTPACCSTRPTVSADGRRAVTVSVTTTTALIDQDKVSRAVEALADDALCDRRMP